MAAPRVFLLLLSAMKLCIGGHCEGIDELGLLRVRIVTKEITREFAAQKRAKLALVEARKEIIREVAAQKSAKVAVVEALQAHEKGLAKSTGEEDEEVEQAEQEDEEEEEDDDRPNAEGELDDRPNIEDELAESDKIEDKQAEQGNLDLADEFEAQHEQKDRGRLSEVLTNINWQVQMVRARYNGSILPAGLRQQVVDFRNLLQTYLSNLR
eukprot:gnl/TRDRNA2_/TRDRNA2_49415_c0_seq2.p1 gnl/TRDRNA2_/TRDRNA2_49415_c0~~gnl/TRDRNA2_/TRDRNA2_49415_c0_seq2.p1  ORF type:complete len:211 (-),score=49.02 gnl/TRDRNA2_/TRDRNA2_49415_c0_seq2:129-761(-)